MEGDAHGQDFSVLSAGNEFSEEYEVLETTVPSSNQLWVDPSILKLLHRIGRGPFGDTWLATIHNSTKDFDEFHEVVVKMLPDAREHIHSLLRKFQSTYQHAEAVKGVCWPQGISIKNGRVSVMLAFVIEVSWSSPAFDCSECRYFRFVTILHRHTSPFFGV